MKVLHEAFCCCICGVNTQVPLRIGAGVSADLDPSRFWIPYDVTHCLGMRSSLKCRKETYKMCVAHPRKWIRFLLASTVLADLDGQNLRFCERRCPMPDHPPFASTECFSTRES